MSLRADALGVLGVEGPGVEQAPAREADVEVAAVGLVQADQAAGLLRQRPEARLALAQLLGLFFLGAAGQLADPPRVAAGLVGDAATNVSPSIILMAG